MIPKRWRKVKEAWLRWIWTGLFLMRCVFTYMPAEYRPMVIEPAHSRRAPVLHHITQYCWSTLRFKSLT